MFLADKDIKNGLKNPSATNVHHSKKAVLMNLFCSQKWPKINPFVLFEYFLRLRRQNGATYKEGGGETIVFSGGGGHKISVWRVVLYPGGS